VVVGTDLSENLAYAESVLEKWHQGEKSLVSPNHHGNGGLMDPIANMFTQIKNAASIGQRDTTVSYSKMKLAILQILKNRGFVQDFAEVTDAAKKYPSGIKISLSYRDKKQSSLKNIKRVSRPGRRVYIGATQIARQTKGRAELLISTSKGIMSGYDARKQGLGGEVICEVS